MSRNHQVMAQLYGGLENNTPVMNLQQYRKITDGHFSAVFASVASTQAYGLSDFNAAVGEMTGNKFGIVEGSLFSIEGAHVPFYRCILAANLESKPYSPDNMKGMTAVHANVFKDEQDNLWRLVGQGDKRHIVQNSADDFDSILEARRQRNAVVANYTAIAEYEDGDYAQFFNHTTAELDFGFVVQHAGADHVLPKGQSKLLRIQPDQIIEAANFPDGMLGKNLSPTAWREKAEAGDKFGIEAYLDYMRSLFGGTAYFKALEKAIRSASIR